MKKEIYNSGAMVENRRCQTVVYKTAKGIAVERNSVYSDQDDVTNYYGEYPEIPADWQKPINDYGVTEAELFIENLKGYKPYRTVVAK